MFMQIAQVHRATLLDGREVVVKVQHDGIKTIILEVGMLGFYGCYDEKSKFRLLFVGMKRLFW